MKGITIKEILRQNGFTVSAVAEKIGESNQNLFGALKKDDVRSSLIERISEVTGILVSTFYGDTTIATASGANSIAVAGNGSKVDAVRATDRFLTELAAQRGLTDKALEHNGRLLGIIEQLSKK